MLVHKWSYTNLYRRWIAMRQRCYCETSGSYGDYGARGVRVCSEWKDSFASFRDWALDSGFKESLTLDRIDGNGDYEPSNCRWVTARQNNNNKRNNRHVTAFGETKNLCEWVNDKRCQVPKGTLTRRIWQGWNPVDAITFPSVPLNQRRWRQPANLPWRMGDTGSGQQERDTNSR